MSETIKWVKGPVDGRVGVIVPYNQKFNDALKAAVPSARFKEDRRTDGWFFDEEAKDVVLPLLERFYVNQEWQRVEWSLSRDEITVDGASLFTVNRDWWKYRSNFPYKFRIVEEQLSTGGSRANPGMFGNLVIDILCRSGAELSPEPASVTPSPEQAGDKPNPLAIFPDDALTAELARRGHDLSVKGVEAVAVLSAFLAAWDEKDESAFKTAVQDARRLLKKEAAE
jgi:hypothetical protein